jgi:hypothetical protein
VIARLVIALAFGAFLVALGSVGARALGIDPPEIGSAAVVGAALYFYLKAVEGLREDLDAARRARDGGGSNGSVDR